MAPSDFALLSSWPAFGCEGHYKHLRSPIRRRSPSLTAAPHRPGLAVRLVSSDGCRPLRRSGDRKLTKLIACALATRRRRSAVDTLVPAYGDADGRDFSPTKCLEQLPHGLHRYIPPCSRCGAERQEVRDAVLEGQFTSRESDLRNWIYGPADPAKAPEAQDYSGTTRSRDAQKKMRRPPSSLPKRDYDKPRPRHL